MRFSTFEWFHARLFGYFWKPCPRCGRMFGGHEIGGFLPIGDGTGRDTATCCPPDA
jgi:hypothetical protein